MAAPKLLLFSSRYLYLNEPELGYNEVTRRDGIVSYAQATLFTSLEQRCDEQMWRLSQRCNPHDVRQQLAVKKDAFWFDDTYGNLSQTRHQQGSPKKLTHLVVRRRSPYWT
jgi:hypothetical protein